MYVTLLYTLRILLDLLQVPTRSHTYYNKVYFFFIVYARESLHKGTFHFGCGRNPIRHSPP